MTTRCTPGRSRARASRPRADLLRQLHHDIRAVEAKLKRPIGILADLQGPKIRIEKFEEGKVLLSAGQEFTLVCRADAPYPDFDALLAASRRRAPTYGSPAVASPLVYHWLSP